MTSKEQALVITAPRASLSASDRLALSRAQSADWSMLLAMLGLVALCCAAVAL